MTDTDKLEPGWPPEIEIYVVRYTKNDIPHNTLHWLKTAAEDHAAEVGGHFRKCRLVPADPAIIGPRLTPPEKE